MYLIINGYEFGQWLRILLWIGLPGMMFLTMVTTWIHYRRGRLAAELLLLRMEGLDDDALLSVEPEDLSGNDERVDVERSVKEGDDDYKENLYKGILWMKEKYEQYRDLADERYDRLKDQLMRMEKKYEDLLMRVQNVSPGLLEPGMTVLGSGVTLPGSKVLEPGSTPAQPTVLEPVAVSMDEPGGSVIMKEAVVRKDVEITKDGATKDAVMKDAERRPLEFSGGTEVVVERAEAGGDRIRIQELEEQLARTQQRFDEEVARLRYQLDDETARGRRLQDEKNAGLDANRLLEQQVLYLSRQLEEKQRMIADLEGLQITDRVKIEELVVKLRNNSTLLMNIYQELDKSLHLNDGPPRD